MAVKMSVNLPEEAVENLRQIAKMRGITMTEALRKAIATEKFLLDAQEKDKAKILVQDDSGTKQLIIT